MIRAAAIALLAVMAGAVSGAADTPTYTVTRKDVEGLSPGMQPIFAGLQYLLNGDQIRQFLSLSDDDARQSWIARFWKMNDPTPTTRKNEMEIEHNIRVNLARQFFTSKKWPGWDKRGEVFIRYGPPDYRGKVWGEVSGRGVEPPAELWYYLHLDFIVAFQNFGLEGEYILSIDPLGVQSKMSPELTEFLLNDVTSTLGDRIPQNYLERYAAPPRPGVPGAPINPADIGVFGSPIEAGKLPRSLETVFNQDRVREMANNYQITVEERPSTYPFNFEDKSLPFYFGVDQFRAGESTVRVEVPVEIPIEVISEGGARFEETFHVEFVIWDPEFAEVFRTKRDVLIRTGPDVSQWANLLPTLAVTALEPGYYRLGVSVRNTSGRESAYRTTFEATSYGRRLGLSDILFARRIRPAGEPSIFTRGALEIVPHPLRAYSRRAPIPVYFEIYNLSVGDDGVADYTIEYKIVPHSSRKEGFLDRFRDETPAVSSKFTGSVHGANDTRQLMIDTANLRRGSYDFLITITDDLTGELAFQRGTFSLVD